MTAQLTIGQLIASGALQMSDGYRTKRIEHGQPGFRIIRVADVDERGIALDGPDFVSKRFRPVIGQKIGKAGDILLTTKGTVGRVAVVPDLNEEVVYSPQLCYFRVVDDTRLHRDYLRYWFASPEFWSQAADRMNNTDMAAYINLADIRSLRISFPSPTEQRAIAEVLGALDDKIAANAKLIGTADQLARAITRRASQEQTPVELEDVAEVVMGSSPPGETLNETGTGAVFYQGVRDFGVRYPKNRVWTTSPTRFADADDSLVSVRAPVGELNLAGERTCIGRGLASVRSKSSRPMTLFHLLRDSPDIWSPFEAEGTVFGSINRRQLETILVPTVPVELEIELETQLDSIEAVVRSALVQNQTLAATRDTLLPPLMSGRLRVNDAERQVEAMV